MIKLFFNDGDYTANLPDSAEEEVTKQLTRPKSKRLYILGIEFSNVVRAEMVKE